MDDSLKEIKIFFSLMLLGAIYGGAIGAGLALVTGNNALAWALAGAWAGAGALAWAGARARAGALARAWALAGTWARAWALAGAWAFALAGALAGALDWALAGAWAFALAGALAGSEAEAFLKYLAKRNQTNLETLIEQHIAWIFSLPIAIFRLLSGNRSSVKSNQKLKTKQRVWDVSLIITFTQELTEVFPEEWDEWQHWISDIMEDRTRMQSKGMNYRLVSLITFYRLIWFVWYIGIDKVYILATRRVTR